MQTWPSFSLAMSFLKEVMRRRESRKEHSVQTNLRLALDEAYNHLVSEIAKVNERVVVVAQTNNPFLMPWKS